MTLKMSSFAFACIGLLLAGTARAAIIISEVNPNGSGSSTYASDWFELTNTGASAVNIGGWTMDDNSNSFALSAPLAGVASIGAGKSVVFVEQGAATVTTDFINAWFGGSAPAGFTIGTYTGGGVGLSTTTDAVNIFDSGGNRVTGVSFGASTVGKTFDNVVGLGSTTLPLPTITTLSAVGVNGAFNSGGSLPEIGSPGTIGNVPEPASLILGGMGLCGLVAGGFLRRK